MIAVKQFKLADFLPAEALANRSTRLLARRALYHLMPTGHAPKAPTGGAREWQARNPHTQIPTFLRGATR